MTESRSWSYLAETSSIILGLGVLAWIWFTRGDSHCPFLPAHHRGLPRDARLKVNPLEPERDSPRAAKSENAAGRHETVDAAAPARISDVEWECIDFPRGSLISATPLAQQDRRDRTMTPVPRGVRVRDRGME